MDFKNIKSIYRETYDYIYDSFANIEYLIKNLSAILTYFYNQKNYAEEFTDNLELNLAYLFCVYEYLEPIINTLENITLSEIHFPEKENAEIYYIDDYVRVTEDYEEDEDIYVDLNYPLNFSENSDTPTCRLYKFKNKEEPNL